MHLTRHPLRTMEGQVHIDWHGRTRMAEQQVHAANFGVVKRLVQYQQIVVIGLQALYGPRQRGRDFRFLMCRLFHCGRAFPGSRRGSYQHDHEVSPVSRFGHSSPVPPRGRSSERRIWPGDYTVEPYSFSLRYKVVLPIPSCRAASSLSPFSSVMACRIARFSSSAKGATPAVSELVMTSGVSGVKIL